MFGSFSHRHQLMELHCRLSDNKTPQISRTLLGILTNLNDVVVWMVVSLLLISSPQVAVSIFLSLYRVHQLQLVLLSLPCSIGFFSSLTRSRYLSLFSLSFSFNLWTARTAKSTIWLDH